MPFIAKNPLSLPEIDNTPSTPSGTRGIIAKKDGLYEVDASGNEAKLGGVQSDFEQNDETAPDHIKNRTHYTEIKSVVYGAFPSSDGLLIINLTSDFNPQKKYKISVGDEIVEAVLKEDEDFYIQGCYMDLYYNETESYIVSNIEPKLFKDIYEEIIVPLPEKYIPDSIARVNSVTSIVKYTSDGFSAIFETPLKKGMQLFYDYTANDQNATGMAKPIKINDDGKLEVSIGDKYHTDFALRGIADENSNVMTFTFIENVDYTVDVKELSIPTPIPSKFLGLSDGLNAGYNNIVTEDSVNSNNFGSNNYIDGKFDNTFGTGNRIEAESSAIFGQDSTILANLCYLFGDRNNSTGRCNFGVGTLIDMLGINSGAIGYGLIVSGNNQLVTGRFNEPDADAVIIIGDGADDANRSNAYVVKKSGQVYIKGDLLLKLTQKDKDKLNSFNSTGDQNANTGSSTAQFGFKNANALDNVMQFGRENTTEGKGGYIYQLGYSNRSSAGQNYQWGRNLKSAVYQQWVAGRYNAEDADALYILGNGTSETERKNALVVKKTNDDAMFAGDIYSKDKKMASETYVEEKVASLVNTAPAALDTLEELAKALGNDPNFATTVLNEIGRVKSSIVNDDWNQNDETKPDYIKNRTHYEIPKVTLGEAHKTEEETAFENGFDGICDVYIDKSLVEVGKEYNYTINGQSGTFIFNNEYMDFGGASGYVYDYGGDVYDWQTSWAYNSTIDVVLYKAGKIKPLDEKYIPDSIARKRDLITFKEKTLIGEFVNAEPWAVITLAEPIDMNKYEYVLNINGAEVETITEGTSTSVRFNYNGEPILDYIGSETSNELSVFPEFEGQDIQLYKLSVKQLDDKYIPDSIARVADVEAMIGIVNDELESILNGGVD